MMKIRLKSFFIIHPSSSIRTYPFNKHPIKSSGVNLVTQAFQYLKKTIYSNKVNVMEDYQDWKKFTWSEIRTHNLNGLFIYYWAHEKK